MATMYQNQGTWYLSVTYAGKRISRSLRTKDKDIAKQLRPVIESVLLAEVSGITARITNLPFKELSKRYLKEKHGWAKSTYELKKHIYARHAAGCPLPDNPNTRAIHTAHINSCWNWGLKNGLISKANKISGSTLGEPRNRVYTTDELDLMFNQITDEDFNSFVRFAYYTGARSGEIRSIQAENIKDGYLLVRGKTGSRTVKLNTQAGKIIYKQDPLWSYSKDYVSHRFKQEVRKLGITDARFHDLRRTFGLNLIKQGMSIYKVSKLLGHKSVRTTEQHYAPLLTAEIEDFEL